MSAMPLRTCCIDGLMVNVPLKILAHASRSACERAMYAVQLHVVPVEDVRSTMSCSVNRVFHTINVAWSWLYHSAIAPAAPAVLSSTNVASVSAAIAAFNTESCDGCSMLYPYWLSGY